LAIGKWVSGAGYGVQCWEVVNQSGGVNVPNNPPSVSAQQTRDIAAGAAKGLWSFLFGSLLGLVALNLVAITQNLNNKIPWDCIEHLPE